MTQTSDSNHAEQPKITPRQSASMISSTIIGVGVLTLPRVAASYAEQSGWISVLLGAALSMIGLAIITVLSRKYPGMTMVGYTDRILGSQSAPMIGKLLSLPIIVGYVAFWSVNTVIVARIFGEVVITTVLTRTPLEVIIGTMLFTAMTLAVYPVEVLARVNEILLPIILIPVLIISLSSFQSSRLENLFPLFDVNWSSFLMGVAASAISFYGYEIMSVFLANTDSKKNYMKHNLYGIMIPGAVYTLIVVSGISVFGTDELSLLAWPTLELVKTTEVPGLILERLESAFLGVWVAAVFTTVGNLYSASVITVRQILGLKKGRIIAIALLPLYYWLSLRAPNVHALFKYQTYIGYVGVIFVFIIPLLLWIISLVRRLQR